MQQAQVCMIWTHTHTRTADHWQLTICVFSLCLPLCPCFSLSHTPSPSTRSLSFSHHVSLDGFSTCVQHSTTHSVTHPRGYWLVIYILYGSILYMITVCQHLTGFFSWLLQQDRQDRVHRGSGFISDHWVPGTCTDEIRDFTGPLCYLFIHSTFCHSRQDHALKTESHPHLSSFIQANCAACQHIFKWM